MRNDNRTIAHASDYVITNQNPASRAAGTAQVRCRGSLWPRAGCCLGKLYLEDNYLLWLKATFSDYSVQLNIYWALRCQRTITLEQTYRDGPEFYTGQFVLDNRRWYRVGLTVLRQPLKLNIFFDPRHLYGAPTHWRSCDDRLGASAQSLDRTMGEALPASSSGRKKGGASLVGGLHPR